MKAWPLKVLIYTDGASRGQPGPASYGIQVLDIERQVIYEEGKLLPKKMTSNMAEYAGALRALGLAVEKGVQSLKLCTDSELMARQIMGKYKVKAPHLQALYRDCKRFIERIPNFSIQHIPRELNERADALAAAALKKDGWFLESAEKTCPVCGSDLSPRSGEARG